MTVKGVWSFFRNKSDLARTCVTSRHWISVNSARPREAFLSMLSPRERKRPSRQVWSRGLALVSSISPKYWAA
ncbi:MAG: hypothetical protein HFI07_13940 [Lachnospiraceae bacterium]|nr:hypothetical protein [Lachnospiraceae bacterium]